MHKRSLNMFDDECEAENDYSLTEKYSKPNQDDGKTNNKTDLDHNYEDEYIDIKSYVVDACTFGNLDVIQQYLESYDVNENLDSGWTPLLYAASFAQDKIIEYLLKNGANPNKHKDGYSPLMALCHSTKDSAAKRLQCLRLLIDAKANVNATDKHRESPLMYACQSQDSEFIAELIKHVKYVNTVDNEQRSALIYAVLGNKPDNVKILLEHSAKTSLVNSHNLTAKDIAIMKGYTEIISLLSTNEDEDQDKIEDACKVSDEFDWRNMFPMLSIENDQVINHDVLTMLRGMGLETYSHCFQGVSLKSFLQLTEEDLCRLGVDISAHRKQFLDYLHKFHKKRWSVESIGSINKSLPYTLHNGVISLGIIAKQVGTMDASLQHTKTQLMKVDDESRSLTEEEISEYKEVIRQYSKCLSTLKKEILKTKALALKIDREDNIGPPATYISPKKNKPNWPFVILSVAIILGVCVIRPVCFQRAWNN